MPQTRPPSPATVDLVYFDAGGGHRASATALKAVLEARQPSWTVRMVDLFAVLDPQARFQRLTGMAPADYYNRKLARGWTFGMAQELKVLQFGIRLLHTRLIDALHAHWSRTQPDAVVSLVPNFNRCLYESVRAARPSAPYATVLTDLADTPPHFWIEPGQDQWFACGTARAVEQALAAGHPRERVLATSGMILHPRFHDRPAIDRAARRAALGLDATTPVGLVLFGGHGSAKMATIARRLPDVPLILLCGRNRALARALREMPARAPRVVVEFTPDVPDYMALADFFVGKPGPGSLSEAVAMGLPVIVESNRWTMPQEVWNATWVREAGVGVVVPSVRDIAPAVADVTARLPEFRTRLGTMRNRAVFEIADWLIERVVAATAGSARIRPEGHSGTIAAACTAFAHFSVSLAANRPSPSGVLGVTSKPAGASRCAVSGRASTVETSALSRRTAAGSDPAGA